MYHHDSLLFAPSTKDYTWPIDHPFPSEFLDGSVVDFSCGSEILEHHHPVEVVYDTISEEDLSPLFSNKEKAWSRMGKFIGSDTSMPLDKQQYQQQQLSSSSSSSSLSSSPKTTQHPNHFSPLHQTHNLPIGSFHSNVYDYRYQPYTPPSPLVVSPTPLDNRHQSYPPSPLGLFPTPLDVTVSLGCYDMMMSLDGNNQNYCGYFNTGSDMSNMCVAQDDIDVDLELPWN